MKKSTTLELSINPAYVSGWGVWESVREIVQNALDAKDAGFGFKVAHAAPVLKVITAGTTLTRDTLLLGSTSKVNSDARGKFGEGYKLAALVLCRAGAGVSIRTGYEVWDFFIEHSTTFGANVLKVKIRTVATFKDQIEVQVKGISIESWDMIQTRLLNLPGAPKTRLKTDEFVQVGRSKILLDERFKGILYCKGIYVGPLPNSYSYGYDLADVQIDRDRKMVDSWSLSACVKNVLREAITSKSLPSDKVYAILATDCGETTAIADAYQWGGADQLTRAVTETFHARHGHATVPVSSMGEAMDVSHVAMSSAMVTSAIKRLIEAEEGNLQQRLVEQRARVAREYGPDDLASDEKSNLTWAVALIQKARPAYNLQKLHVVDFIGQQIVGRADDGNVRLSKKILLDRRELLTTLIHELAHDAGSDGSVEHSREIEHLAADIVIAIDTIVTYALASN